MSPVLMSSSSDPSFQGVIIIVALVAGFIKWLWENWQERLAAGKRPPPPPDPAEQRLREAAWRRQTGQSMPPPVPPVAPTVFAELRKAWQELQETAKAAQDPAYPVRSTPPPVPQAQQQSRHSARPSVPVSQAPSVVIAPPTVTTGELQALESHLTRPRVPVPPLLAALRGLRSDPALMRQAIILQEVLGPPKALQTSGDLAN